MTERKFSIVMLMAVLTAGFALNGCGSLISQPSTPTQSRPSKHVEKVSWAEYPGIPSKDYTVVGVIILREADPSTLSSDLMERAVDMGAHDIINVRIDEERMLGNTRVVAASAIAIRYTDETLILPIQTSPNQQQPQSQQPQPQRTGLFNF